MTACKEFMPTHTPQTPTKIRSRSLFSSPGRACPPAFSFFFPFGLCSIPFCKFKITAMYLIHHVACAQFFYFLCYFCCCWWWWCWIFFSRSFVYIFINFIVVNFFFRPRLESERECPKGRRSLRFRHMNIFLVLGMDICSDQRKCERLCAVAADDVDDEKYAPLEMDIRHAE